MVVSVAISTRRDTDIIKRLDSVNSKSAYIKGLIARNEGLEDNYSSGIVFNGSAASIDTSKAIYYLHISLNPDTDADIINVLRSLHSMTMTDYIRSLVYDDIASKSGKSWTQLSSRIDINDYRTSAVFAADRFIELAEKLTDAGCQDKAAECIALAEKLNAWVSKIIITED